MSKAMWNEFKENTKDFFLNPERNPDGSRMPGVNKQNVTAVLIAGFVGWLLLTLTIGASVKRTLKKVPVVKMLFKKSAPRRATRRATSRRRR
jgi:hypothetical protein